QLLSRAHHRLFLKRHQKQGRWEGSRGLPSDRLIEIPYSLWVAHYLFVYHLLKKDLYNHLYCLSPHWHLLFAAQIPYCSNTENQTSQLSLSRLTLELFLRTSYNHLLI